MLRFYIDEELVDDPADWATFQESIVRDDTLKALVIKYPSSLEFHGSGYAKLIEIKSMLGVCSETPFRMEESCGDGYFEEVFAGTIKGTNITYDHVKCLATAEITDNNYFSTIKSNRNIKVDLTTRLSKNENEIVAPQRIDVKFYTPTTGSFFSVPRRSYDVFDVLTYLVSWMSDGELTFESTFFSTRPSGEDICIVLGDEMLAGESRINMFMSYQMLFEELDKKFNLYSSVEGDTLRIEEFGYFFNNSPTVTLEDVPNLTESSRIEVLYSSVVLGSEEFKNKNPTNSLPDFRLQFKEESYPVSGNCNTDNVLNLVSEFVIDHNTIEQILNGDELHLDKIYMIQYTKGVTNEATQNFYYAPSDPPTVPVLYNEIFLSSNSWVIDQIDELSLLDVGRLADSPVLNLGTGFSIPFDLVNSDPDSGFVIPSFYTFLYDGYYDLTYSLEIKNKVGFPVGGTVLTLLPLGTSPIELPSDADRTEPTNITNTDETLIWNFREVFIEAGNTLGGFLSGFPFTTCVLGVNSELTINSEFKIIPAGISDSFRNGQFTFSYPISRDVYNGIKADLKTKIDFTLFGDKYSGWIKTLTRKLSTGECEIILIDQV